MKILKNLFVVGLMTLSMQLFGSVGDAPEKFIIERYVKNHRSAIGDYNKLISGQISGGWVEEEDLLGKKFQRKMTPCEKSCLLDAIEADKAKSLPWGLRWLAAFWVENTIDFDCKFEMNHMDSTIKPSVEEHLAAMIGKVNSDNYFLNDTSETENRAVEAVIINKVAIPIVQNRSTDVKERVKEHFENLEADEIARIIKDNRSLYSGLEHKYHNSMRLHRQKSPEFKLSQSSQKDRQKFCKNLWPMIKDETRDQQIARLKKENPVDTNPATNRFARLFDHSVNKQTQAPVVAPKVEIAKEAQEPLRPRESRNDDQKPLISRLYQIEMTDGVVTRKHADGSKEIISTGHKKDDVAGAFDLLFAMARADADNKKK